MADYIFPFAADGRAERLAKREPKLVTREGLAEYLRQKIINLVCCALIPHSISGDLLLLPTKDCT